MYRLLMTSAMSRMWGEMKAGEWEHEWGHNKRDSKRRAVRKRFYSRLRSCRPGEVDGVRRHGARGPASGVASYLDMHFALLHSSTPRELAHHHLQDLSAIWPTAARATDKAETAGGRVIAPEGWIAPIRGCPK
jgi:hypothetical protein